MILLHFSGYLIQVILEMELVKNGDIRLKFNRNDTKRH